MTTYSYFSFLMQKLKLANSTFSDTLLYLIDILIVALLKSNWLYSLYKTIIVQNIHRIVYKLI